MRVEDQLAMVGVVAEAAVIAVMVWRRTYRSLPVFFCYIVWGVAGDSTVLILRTLVNYRTLYPFEIEIYIDSVFQYLVLIELAWSTLRPIRRSLSGGFLLSISLVIAAGAVLAWPLSRVRETPGYPLPFLVALHAERAFALLRMLFFLMLAACSHILRIGWHDRELQVATGLGFYSLVSLAAALVHSHQSFGWPYYYVDLAVGLSYFLSLAYWIWSFAQPEAERREITPEMRHFLLGMAGVLRQQRRRMAAPKQ